MNACRAFFVICPVSKEKWEFICVMSVNKFYRINCLGNLFGKKKRGQSTMHALHGKACSCMVTVSFNPRFIAGVKGMTSERLEHQL